jgi:hypothetical protein
MIAKQARVLSVVRVRRLFPFLERGTSFQGDSAGKMSTVQDLGDTRIGMHTPDIFFTLSPHLAWAHNFNPGGAPAFPTV